MRLVNTPSLRKAFTLVELLLFLGILALISSAVVGLLLATEDARVRQRVTAAVEQNGAQVLFTLTRTARRAEQVLDPPAGQTGSTLALQMAQTGEFPTIFSSTASGAFLQAQKENVFPILGAGIAVEELAFRSLGDGETYGVSFSFTLSAVIPIPSKPIYRKRFESAVTLDPDDMNEAGGCVSCPVPICQDGVYTWWHCQDEECVESEETVACGG